ncbi:patatin-like phospholipase family protein [Bradyrhizobium sp. GCM10023182]|uniref:Patatin-like phospholipase family protein n=1 Tax=Bradyrhizobium zhengyangense TaxID=2911009 RepID=A0ABS9LPD3_9BRAD|nr:patatin-like phospholipase family protein [Bradyrhizobium zhengyangense]MCG2641128.1 patatin-like phospholipase family protein [Bradyrhizobium zhengyangense]MCG2668844.1 patatin-like phospholipase family protein [Bradyrhizobium zhengyangense]
MDALAKDKVEVGLVLQGGGALGAYEFGAIEALLELMDTVDRAGRTITLAAVTGVSIGAINAACVVGAAGRADAKLRLNGLWSELSLGNHWWGIADHDLALFGVHGFYKQRYDYWDVLNWKNFYDTSPMLETLKNHVDFAALNASPTAFVVTAVDVASGELTRFRNHPRKDEQQIAIKPQHVLASGSLPPGFPATPIDNRTFWDGGIVDNTPLGDAIEAFSGAADVDRILVVMNLFRNKRAAPKNMIEVNDRLSELRYGNRLRQDGANAAVINELLQTIEALSAAVPEAARTPDLDRRVTQAQRFKTLGAITNIDLADSDLVKAAGLLEEAEDSGAFRDFSAGGIERRRKAGYRLAQVKLDEVFKARGLLPALH